MTQMRQTHDPNMRNPHIWTQSKVQIYTLNAEQGADLHLDLEQGEDLHFVGPKKGTFRTGGFCVFKFDGPGSRPYRFK